MNQGSNTTLEVEAAGPGLTEFLVFAEDGVMVVDDVTIDYYD